MPKRHFNVHLCERERSADHWYAVTYVCEAGRLERAAVRQFENGAPFFITLREMASGQWWVKTVTADACLPTTNHLRRAALAHSQRAKLAATLPPYITYIT
jgi:hypothetical protein